jgi:uncharacterized protein (DUF1778 family)
MNKNLKTKQIAIRFDEDSYEMISKHARAEHRDLGSFVRHATLFYIEHFADKRRASPEKKGGEQ